MNKSLVVCMLLIVAFGAIGVAADGANGVGRCQVGELRCEYLNNPLGLDTHKPRFTWAIRSKERAERQTAYQLLVASSLDALANNQGDLWDSGRVKSEQSVLVEYAGAALASGADCYWKVRIWDANDEPSGWSNPARFSVGLVAEGDWKGRWIGMDSADDHEEPWFRKTFALERKPDSALAYVASVGYHELYVNGRRVGDCVLNPSVSCLAKRVLYVTYDIADYLKPGENVVAVWLAPGWSLFKSVNATADFQLSKKPLLLSQLNVVADKGKTLSIASDDTWKCHLSCEKHLGEWTYCNFGGDRIDATKELPGWNDVGLDEADWDRATVYDFHRMLSPDLVEPNRKCEAIHPTSVTQKGPRKYLVDMGRFYTGWVEARLKGVPGSTVAISASYLDNLECQYNQRNEYVIGTSGVGRFCNRFSYHGCRYITIDGVDAAPALADIVGYRIGNDLRRAGGFDCSNRLLKRIYDADLNNNLNLLTGGMPADCPHRERLGYGDSSLGAIEAMLLSFESGAWTTKWARDWCDIQQEDGYVGHTAPTMDGGGAPWLSGSIVMVPWNVFQFCGDRRLLETTYPQINRWLAFLQTQCDAEGLLKSFIRPGTAFPQWCFIGDWVTPHGSELSDSPEALLFNNCYYLTALRTAAQIARALGKDDDVKDFEACAERLAGALNKRFFNPTNDRYIDTRQTHLVMPLVADAVPRDHVAGVMANLRNDIVVTHDGHLDVGDPGVYYMTRYLAEHGANDLVFTYINQKTYPGYGFFIEQGLDTWPETWDAKEPPSLIHGCFSGISKWLVSAVAGIAADPASPGFKHFVVKPAIVGDITWAKAHYDSAYGRIACHWTIESGRLVMKVEVPVGTTATVYVPATDVAAVTESGKAISETWGVKFLRMEDGCAIFDVQSGSYEFSASKSAP